MASTCVALEGSGLFQLDVAVTEVSFLVSAAGVWACWATAIVASVVRGTCGTAMQQLLQQPLRQYFGILIASVPARDVSEAKPFADLLRNAGFQVGTFTVC